MNKQVDWQAYKNWYTAELPSGVWMMDENEPAEFKETEAFDDGDYTRVTQDCFTAWVPVRFISEVEG